jgi:tRNA-dihydrouridine synthase A
LSPKENRSVPPLDYSRVYRLKRDYPDLHIVLNGGITTTDQVQQHLRHIDAVMIGRQAYQEPWFLAELEQALFAAPDRDRQSVMEGMSAYIERELADGVPLQQMTRHLLGLFNAQPGARAWRRYLSENAYRPDAGIEVLRSALQKLPKAA